jgi:hypothetical protein
MKNYNIIFLDIDGVINIYDKEENLKTYRDEFGHIFSKKCVKHLCNIIEKTNAKLVITSTWRHDGLDKMREMWKKRDLPGEIIGLTPSYRAIIRSDWFIDDPVCMKKIGSHSVPRGFEIKRWFDMIKYDPEHKDKIKVDNYVIIDDDSDMLYEQRNNFVKCDYRIGINQDVENKCLNILGIEDDPLGDHIKNLIKKEKDREGYYGSPDYCILRSKLIVSLQKEGCIGDNPYAEKFLFKDVTNDEFVKFFETTVHMNEPNPDLNRECDFPIETFEDGGIIFEIMYGQGSSYSCTLKD